jgi:hypothetical protein
LVSSGDGSRSASDDGRRRGNGGASSPATLARRAAAELGGLLGREPEAIVSVDRSDDGWRIGVEVLEIRRVPDTADVLAEYEVDVDEDGQLLGYRRARRYTRGQVEERR